jgi:hypothetical protein
MPKNQKKMGKLPIHHELPGAAPESGPGTGKNKARL